MGRILEGKSISLMVEEALQAYLHKHTHIDFKDPEPDASDANMA